MMIWSTLVFLLAATVGMLLLVTVFLCWLRNDALETGENYRQKSMQALDERNRLAKAIQTHRAATKVPLDHDTELYRELRTVMGEWK